MIAFCKSGVLDVSDALPISCIITSYNRRDLLKRAVASVLDQSRSVAEIIVADDASTDGSVEFIADLGRRYSNITPVLREQNIGVAANRDLAIRQASQPFVTHLDGDDLFAPTKIEAEWSALGGDPDAVAYSYIALITTRMFLRSSVLDPGLTAEGKKEAVFANFVTRSGPLPRDMLLSKELYIKAGGMTHGVALYEDWEFKMRLAAMAHGWRHSRAIGTLYIHQPNSLSHSEPEEHSKWKRHALESVRKHLSGVLGEDEAQMWMAETSEKSEQWPAPGSRAAAAKHLRKRWQNQILTHGRFLRLAVQLQSILTKTAEF